MKKFKRIATFVLSMVMLFSFISTHSFAAVNELESEYEYLTEYAILTRNFKMNGEEFASYAQVYASEYLVYDCDMGAKTWVDNVNIDFPLMDGLMTRAAYVHLEAEFESGLTGTLEDAEIYPTGAEGGYVLLFAQNVENVDEEDYLVSFRTTHKVLIGYRRYDPLNTDFYDQEDGTNTIYIFKTAD